MPYSGLCVSAIYHWHCLSATLLQLFWACYEMTSIPVHIWRSAPSNTGLQLMKIDVEGRTIFDSPRYNTHSQQLNTSLLAAARMRLLKRVSQRGLVARYRGEESVNKLNSSNTPTPCRSMRMSVACNLPPCSRSSWCESRIHLEKPYISSHVGKYEKSRSPSGSCWLSSLCYLLLVKA